MRLFTWHDVEMEFFKSREKWADSWNRVDVYNDEIVINVNPHTNDSLQNENALKKIFSGHYVGESLLLDFDREKMAIIFEAGTEDDRETFPESPLFKDPFSEISEPELKDLPVPVIAFHSYKGGTGRTLSLISLAQEITELYEDTKKILIIDADLEAPGLTWMLKDSNGYPAISYLDVLSLMHFHNMDGELAGKIAAFIKKNQFTMETSRLQVEQYFLPVYSSMEQTWNIFSTPEKIIASQENKYIISEFISMVGKRLNVDLILVDLRAGITEFSSPFLFDPRVQKYMVTSTSMQSVKGTQLILDRIYEKMPSVLQNTRILLTMIPEEMEENSIQKIEDILSEKISNEIRREHSDENTLGTEDLLVRDSFLSRIRFDSRFISLGNFSATCSLLKGSKLSEVMAEISRNLFEQPVNNTLSDEQIHQTLQAIHRLASQEVTAEGNTSSKMLSTGSIREIVNDFLTTIPQIVIVGAKGSGKTYVYKQMMAKQTWGGFLRIVDHAVDSSMDHAMILPLLESVNSSHLQPLRQKCIKRVLEELPELSISPNITSANLSAIVNECDSTTDWTKLWRSIILKTLGGKFDSLEHLNLYLNEKNRKIIFLIDGLEDLVTRLQDQTNCNWKAAIRTVTQDLINELRNLPGGNIGIVIFVRKDIAEEAISVNFAQFMNQYQRYELIWTPTEALRLALWICSQAVPDVFGKNTDILRASRAALEKELEILWGKKLGKKDSREAISARWIIAALSDFTGQLQARDIVRFLEYATKTHADVIIRYPDRYIMPSEIRKAIPECSRDKYGEIKDEMKTIYQILQKFEKMDNDKKNLPLIFDQIALTSDEIAKLENQGYLRSADQQYYLPEIIRYALGFRYGKGARPKVLSMSKK